MTKNISPSELAKKLGKDPKWVRVRIRDGRIRATMGGASGKRWSISSREANRVASEAKK